MCPRRWTPKDIHTKYVAVAVLATKLAGNVGMDTKVHDCELLDRVPVDFNAAKKTETPACMHLVAHLAELGTKSGKWEVGLVDAVAIELEPYPTVSVCV